MADNAQKTPLSISLNRHTSQRIDSNQQGLPKSFPASVVSVDETGTIVTIQFELKSDVFTPPQVQCALATDEWSRPPITKGTKGYVVPADVYLGGVTGLGGGTATYDKQANLSTLVFHPLGNTEFDKLYAPDKYVLLGPNGVIIRDKAGAAVVNIGPVSGGAKNVIQTALINATSDADAQAKGVPLNGWYENNGAVKVRIS